MLWRSHRESEEHAMAKNKQTLELVPAEQLPRKWPFGGSEKTGKVASVHEPLARSNDFNGRLPLSRVTAHLGSHWPSYDDILLAQNSYIWLINTFFVEIA
jgi:hypothetical protein